MVSNIYKKACRLLSLIIMVSLLHVTHAIPAVNDLLVMPAEKIKDPFSSIWMDVVNTGNRLVAVGERGFIIFSNDSGENWTQADVPTGVTLTSVYFPTAQHGWAVGHDGVILHTSDGGETWEKQMDGVQINKMMISQVNQVLKALESKGAEAGEAENEELACKIDDCSFFVKDWEMLSGEGACTPLMDVWFRNEREGIAVGAFGIILRTLDGGASWQPILDCIDNVGGYHYYGITQSGQKLFIDGEVGMLFRSDDYGQSWVSLTSPYEGSFFGIVGNSNPEFVLVFGLQGKAFYSKDDGSTWNESDKNSEATLAAGTVIGDHTVLLISNDGILYQSRDNGKSFDTLSFRITGGLSLTQAPDGQVVVVGLRGISRIQLP